MDQVSGFEPAKALVRGLPLPLPLALLESFSQLHLSLRDGREYRAMCAMRRMKMKGGSKCEEEEARGAACI